MTRVNPIEALYRARDALELAAAEQARQAEPTPDQLSAYGSAIVSTLAAAGELATVLAGQVADYDEQRLREQATQNHPAEKLRAALSHLTALQEVLANALVDARHYWTAAAGMHDDLQADRE